MGLDGVEMIMELEDEFGLAIPGEAAEHMRTVGDTVDYLIARLREGAGTRPGGCRSARTFYALRRALTNRFGVARHAVRTTSAIGSLVPPGGRHRWPAVAAAAGLRRERRRLFRSPFPPPETTVRDLIATRGRPDFLAGGTADERAVYDRVRTIVSEQMGVRLEDISRRTRYVEDLGMG